jgi:hypothetical protein
MMPPGGISYIGCRLIHRSAWKGKSANFAITEFSEVRSQKAEKASGHTSEVPSVALAL